MLPKFLAALSLILILGPEAAAPGQTLPKFEEIYGLVRSNLSQADQVSLDQAAVRGLLAELRPQIQLISSNPPAASEPSTFDPSISKVELYDAFYGYIRLPGVAGGLAESLGTALAKLNATNKVKGLILDLRFARGTDFSAAAAVADLFLAEEKPLLYVGSDPIRAKAKTNAVTCPLAVLVNRETSGAAEVLAAIMREVGGTVIIGAPTSGNAGVFKHFPLSSGQTLRIATSGVKLGNGREFSPKGITPDILVEIPAEAERGYWDDPFQAAASGSARFKATNSLDRVSLAGRPRLNEAELVRMQRERQNSDGDPIATKGEAERPAFLADPVLVRALDLLKGLVLVQDPRSN